MRCAHDFLIRDAKLGAGSVVEKITTCHKQAWMEEKVGRSLFQFYYIYFGRDIYIIVLQACTSPEIECTEKATGLR